MSDYLTNLAARALGLGRLRPQSSAWFEETPADEDLTDDPADEPLRPPAVWPSASADSPPAASAESTRSSDSRSPRVAAPGVSAFAPSDKPFPILPVRPTRQMPAVPRPVESSPPAMPSSVRPSPPGQADHAIATPDATTQGRRGVPAADIPIAPLPDASPTARPVHARPDDATPASPTQPRAVDHAPPRQSPSKTGRRADESIVRPPSHVQPAPGEEFLAHPPSTITSGDRAPSLPHAPAPGDRTLLPATAVPTTLAPGSSLEPTIPQTAASGAVLFSAVAPTSSGPLLPASDRSPPTALPSVQPEPSARRPASRLQSDHGPVRPDPDGLPVRRGVRRAEPDEPPPVVVTIGRLEVRPPSPTPTPTRPAERRVGPRLTLDGYLRRRAAGATDE